MKKEDRRLMMRRTWDRKHYCTVSCRVPRETAIRFAALCRRYGKTPYQALKDAIEDALRHDGDAKAQRPPRQCSMRHEFDIESAHHVAPFPKDRAA